MTIPAGTLVPRDAREFGDYQLIAKLATGGMAEIFLARKAGAPASELIVLKRILPHLAEDEHFVTMFRDEADLASQLRHKNICQVESFGEIGGTWYIAMEYLHGVPLSRMMTRLSKAAKMLDVRVVAGIIAQACEGLHAAHEAVGPDGAPLNVVHRDVSPPNIMVCHDGTVKLLDFGIAKARGANSRTRTGTVKGKNAYMSPEQILGKPLDRRSDVFALATVMYEMLAIKRLFHRDSDFLTFKAITEEPIPDIRERRPDLTPGVRAALVQAMARDPNGRFPTAAGFAAALRGAVATQGGPASTNDLARLLFTDFGDEMAARDEILKAADDQAIQPPSPPKPPPVPKPPVHNLALATTAEVPAARSGELAHRPRHASAQFPIVPSMIVTTQSGNTAPVPLLLPEGVLDLSDKSAVSPDTWMANPNTDLLRGHRWKGVFRVLIVLGVLAAIGAIVAVVMTRGSSTSTEPSEPVVSTSTPDAAVVIVVDAHVGPTKEEIEAMARWGYLTLKSSAKATVYVDGLLVGEAPLLRYPVKPGFHKVKIVGPKKKEKHLDVTILGGQDTNEGMITW